MKMNTIYTIVNMKGGFAKLQLRENGKKKTIALTEFLNDGTKILVSEFDVYEGYRRMGYGTVLMYALMGVARKEGIPIVLFAVDESVKFYEKMDFKSLRKWKKGKYNGVTLTVTNLHEGVAFNKQVGGDDLIWIPPNLNDVLISL